MWKYLANSKAHCRSQPLVSDWKPGAARRPPFPESRGVPALVEDSSVPKAHKQLSQGYLGPKQSKERRAKNEDLILGALGLPSKLCCKKGLTEKRRPHRD